MITEAKIREGIHGSHFRLHYQPKISLVTGEIVGAEALIRWIEPDGSMLQPADFIPIAEKSSLIKEITKHIFTLLVDDLLILHRSKTIPISFNVSTKDFEDTVLVGKILDSLSKYGMDSTAIEVEITESQAFACSDHVMTNMSLLQEAGIGLTMDDYGTGYSSIDALSRWPFTTIKLDQGIIGRMLNSEKNATIVRSSIRLGHELHINVVAEGVETCEQYQFLLEAGCTFGQGYLVSKALPIDQFIVFAELFSVLPGVPTGLIHMALIDHVQWRRQMVSFALKRAELLADSPLRQSQGYPALAINECCLGAWYFGAGQTLSGHGAFIALDAHHRMLHDIGAKLVHHIRAGARTSEIGPMLGDLTKCSVSMLGLLEALEDIGLTDTPLQH